MSSTPELQVLCRRLASTDAADVPQLCPLLVRHIQRCESVLSLAVDQKPRDGAPEHSVLVHKLKTQITTLLNNGRSQPGRFAAAVLIKAVVDAGGYECLRTSEPWVRGLLTIVQKNDSFPAKEIAIVTLTRIYVLLFDFQALVREVASPTLPAFVTACLALTKSQQPTTPPSRLLKAVAKALCTLTPLYPTTLRPFSTLIKAAFNAYIAPAASERRLVPLGLRESSRRLLVLQHYTTPKNGHADEWAKTLAGFVKASHATADQVFRAVQESWESTSGYVRQAVTLDGQAHGGGDAADSLATWVGLSSGADRLVGLLETSAEFLKSPTKTSVTTPISAILDLTARITLIVPPQKGKKNRDDTQLHAAAGREEKDDLWSILPDIHAAVIDLLTALTQRLHESALPIAADILHQAVRVFDAHHQIPLIRQRAYILIHALLVLHGPSMSKLSVNALDTTIQSTCRDLLAASGHAGPKPSQAPKDTNPTAGRSNGSNSKARPSSNADAYLTTQSKTSATTSTALRATHLAAASTLLAAFLSHLPQQHLKQALRALIDRTAVLAHSKDAMIASVLNPYRMRTGKILASVAPFLARDFPRSWEVEVLRSNMQTVKGGVLVDDVAADGADDVEMLERMQRKGSEDGESDEDLDALEDNEVEEQNGGDEQDGDHETADAEPAPPAGFDFKSVQEPVAERTTRVTRSGKSASGEAVVVVETKKKETVMLSSTLKRKDDQVVNEPPAKRLDTGKAPEIIGGGKMDVDAGGEEDSDSDGDSSVQLNAALDDDSDEEENS
ncbi:unnamed protein product [Discula destructiva]